MIDSSTATAHRCETRCITMAERGRNCVHIDVPRYSKAWWLSGFVEWRFVASTQQVTRTQHFLFTDYLKLAGNGDVRCMHTKACLTVDCMAPWAHVCSPSTIWLSVRRFASTSNRRCAVLIMRATRMLCKNAKGKSSIGVLVVTDLGYDVLLPFIVFNYSFQTNCLQIYRTDLWQLCRICRTMAMNLKVVFGPNGHCRDDQFLPALATEVSSGDIR